MFKNIKKNYFIMISTFLILYFIFNLLEGLNLEEYFITSKAKKIKDTNNKLRIFVKKANGNKCPRCWKIVEDKCLRCEAIMSK